MAAVVAAVVAGVVAGFVALCRVGRGQRGAVAVVAGYGIVLGLCLLFLQVVIVNLDWSSPI